LRDADDCRQRHNCRRYDGSCYSSTYANSEIGSTHSNFRHGYLAGAF